MTKLSIQDCIIEDAAKILKRDKPGNTTVVNLLETLVELKGFKRGTVIDEVPGCIRCDDVYISYLGRAIQFVTVKEHVPDQVLEAFDSLEPTVYPDSPLVA